MSSTRQLINEWDGRTTTGIVAAGPFEVILSSLLHERENGSASPESFSWISIDTPVASQNWTYRMTEVRILFPSRPYVTRTELGRKLLALRRRAIESGMSLYDADTILAAVRRNRGERTHEEEDVP